MRAVLLLAFVVSALALGRYPLERPARLDWSRVGGQKIIDPLPHTYLNAAALPTEWNWGNISGVNYVSVARNQHIPVYCGSCWAHGPTSSLNDRLAILRKGKWPEVNMAPQIIVDCGDAGSCGGGFPEGVYSWIESHGVADETCYNYQAVDGECKLGQCSTCFSNGTCVAVKKFTEYKVTQYGGVSGADKMKAEIYARGPIGCGISVNDAFEDYKGGIFSGNSYGINHELAVVGWGVEKGVEYWIGRNSWGTYWGENGFFRIMMHKNNLEIETDCDWGVLQATTPAAEASQLNQRPWIHKTIAPQPNQKPLFGGPSIVVRSPPTSHVTSPLPFSYMPPSALPTAYDPRNINGVDMTTPNWNQNNPKYCNGGWAMATASALGDRIKIARKNAFPEVYLSPQVLLNCVPAGQFEGQENAGCTAGDPSKAYEYISQKGIVDETCTNYEAQSLACTDINVCKNCMPSKGCWAMTPHKTFHITQYGQVSGTDAIMAEIYARGPVACSVAITPEFEAYTTGIFEDKTGKTSRDHEIEVAGWGTDNGVDYWVARNSWGSFWGEGGWFRIVRGKNNLGIESHCDWAVPDPKDFPHFP